MEKLSRRYFAIGFISFASDVLIGQRRQNQENPLVSRYRDRMRTIAQLLLMIGLVARPPCAALDFGSAELPWAVVDQPYTPPPLRVYGTARCPAGDVTFAVSGQLPPGLSLTAL